MKSFYTVSDCLKSVEIYSDRATADLSRMTVRGDAAAATNAELAKAWAIAAGACK